MRPFRLLSMLLPVLLCAVNARAEEHHYFVGRGFDVGLWGTGLDAVPDLRNPEERAFNNVIRSPTTQGIGRIHYAISGLGRRKNFKMAIDFNTYRFGANLTARNVGVPGLDITLFTKSEWLLTGLLVHHMRRGDNVRELGFIAYYASAGMKFTQSLWRHLSADGEVVARTWMFHRGLRTARDFVMPPSFQSLEPRVRLRWADVRTKQETLGLPEGLHAVLEAGVDFRNGSTPWGGVGGVESKRNNVGPGQFPRRVAARGVWGRPLAARRGWLTLSGEAAYGLDEDDLTRTRIGGMNPSTVSLPGAAWGEYFSERFGMGHAEVGLFATPFLYTGISVHAGVINDPHRSGRLDDYQFMTAVAAETRMGIGRLGFIRFRVGGSPQVERKKTQGSLGFLFWWEIGNLLDRTLMGT